MPGVRSLLLALVLVAAATAPAAMVTGQESVYEADTDHGLTEQRAVESYAEDGAATGEIYGLNASITVADEAGDAGLQDILYRSAGRVFIRLDYNEELARTIRFYIPQSYLTPQLKQGLEATESDVTADLEPVKNRNYTAVTVAVDGPTEAVFPVSVSRGLIADTRSDVAGIVGNVTGFELPSLTDPGTEWHYVNADALNDSTADYIPANATTIQRDTSTAAEDPDWVPVPACSDGTADLCTYTKADHPDRTYLLFTGSDPSTVRYRQERSVSGNLGTAINDAVNGADQLVDEVFSFLGGDDGGD